VALAQAGLVVLELQVQVPRGLAGEYRVIGELGIPVRAVAPGAVLGLLATRLDVRLSSATGTCAAHHDGHGSESRHRAAAKPGPEGRRGRRSPAIASAHSSSDDTR